MYDNILLPTDGSDGIEAVVMHAETLAEQFDSTLHVLSVSDTRNRFETPSSGLSTEAWTEAERERAEEATEVTVESLSDAVTIETAIVAGVPRAAILEYIDDNGIDLVVMGTHGRSGIDRYLIGSVTEKVVRHSPVPVVTVRLGA
jgi:nucleotide-binding universal stress UspA family protein